VAGSPLLSVLRNQDPRAFMQITGDWKTLLRMHFLYAAADSGLLSALSSPRSREELLRELEVRRPDLLDALLDLGVSLGELSERHGLYRVTGSRSRALGSDRNDALAAMIEANLTYYNDAFRDFSHRLKGGALDEGIHAIGPLVARVSKIAEPFVDHFLRKVVRERDPARVLDVGCGSGGHLRTVLEEAPRSRGIGLELDADVAKEARKNLREWGLAERAEIHREDLRSLPVDGQDPFDLILLFSVIYYFPLSERGAVLGKLRRRLSPGGALVVATSCRGRGVDLFSANLNLATSSMEGLTPLPEPGEMEAQLREAGFGAVIRRRLISRSTYFGFIAS